MLRSVRSLYGYKIMAKDGAIGKVHEFFFEDETWLVRYLVVGTGRWLPSRQVLISPVAFGKADWESKAFHVILTREQVESSPGIEKDQPVSRRHLIELFRYYGWPPYWPVGAGFNMSPPATAEEEDEGEEAANPHLRSTRAVAGYNITASDGDIGHVDDFIVDDEEWALRYVVVDTRNWLPGRRVLVAPRWIEYIDWSMKRVAMALTKELIKNSPEYDPAQPVNREYEVRLYDY
jgi:sporulation protein YlmC with PRC-barrel domain